MNIERVKTIIEAYGGDPSRWPQDERNEALAMLEQSDELELLMNDARQLDALLDAISPADAPNHALRAQILRIAKGSSAPTTIERLLEWLLDGTPTERVLRPAMASLLPLLLGFAIGVVTPDNGVNEVLAQDALADEVALLAFIDTEQMDFDQ